MDKAAMYKLTYGLFVLTAKEGEKENGCIINTAMQVTTSPNRIIIVVNKANYTHDMVMRTREFNVSCLGTGASFDVFKHFGFQSGKNVNKMGACYPHAKNGIPVRGKRGGGLYFRQGGFRNGLGDAHDVSGGRDGREGAK